MNFRNGAAALVASFSMLGGFATAQTQPLDLRGAVAYALDHSPTILNRKATLASADATFARLHAAEYPPITGLLQNTVEKSANVSGSFQQFGLTQATTYSQNTAQLGTQWTVYNGSLSQVQAQQAKRQADAARNDLRRSQQQIAQDVTSAFYAVAARHENVQLTTADRAYQQALLGVARNNERVGRAAGVDVLRARVNELRSEATLATAQSDEATARETLAQTIGAPPDQSFAVETVLPEPILPTTSLATLVATAKANRSDIASARSSLGAARLANSLIDTDRIPALTLNASFGNQFSPTSYGAQLAQLQNPLLGGSPNASLARGNLGFWQIGATETWQVGLIDYGSRRAQHRSAHAGIDAASATLTTTENAVETDVRQALRSAQTAFANLATAKEASSLGAESARIAQLQYKNGLISLTDATQAEQTNLSAQNDLVNARVTYISAIVHLRVSLGTSDPIAVVDLRK